nr:hypothetical protein Iba_chr02dCG16860 [Ipomoea batatas]
MTWNKRLSPLPRPKIAAFRGRKLHVKKEIGAGATLVSNDTVPSFFTKSAAGIRLSSRAVSYFIAVFVIVEGSDIFQCFCNSAPDSRRLDSIRSTTLATTTRTTTAITWGIGFSRFYFCEALARQYIADIDGTCCPTRVTFVRILDITKASESKFMFLPRRITNDRDFRISDSLQSQFPNGHHSQAASLCHKEVPENTEKQEKRAKKEIIWHSANQWPDLKAGHGHVEMAIMGGGKEMQKG